MPFTCSLNTQPRLDACPFRKCCLQTRDLVFDLDQVNVTQNGVLRQSLSGKHYNGSGTKARYGQLGADRMYT